MAGTSLLSLIDDIATLLDDVAILTKVAAKKTAGVLGDDLALNAEQVTGVMTERELPVVWAVAKGSALNKVILVPVALGISFVAPFLITPLLMLGGGFLCFEGFEKVFHKLFHAKEEAKDSEALVAALVDTNVDMVEFEKTKIKGAIRTDFILSAEIVVISLGTVASEPMMKQFLMLVAISALMTVGVYGLVAGIVKLDDLGFYLRKQTDTFRPKVGTAIVSFAPYLMKGLGIIGTIAMFLVGGGIIAHGIPGVEALIHSASEAAGPVGAIVPTLINGIIGVITGGLVVAAVTGIKKFIPKKQEAAPASLEK